MPRAVSAVLALLVAGSLSGCQLAAGYLVTDFSLAVEPSEATLAAGDTLEVTVRVERFLGIDASPFPVTLTLHRAADGVSLAGAESVEIPSGIDEEVVTLQVDPGTALGEGEVVFRGSGVVKSRDATLTLVIAPPG